jgi:nucleoside-diphosphate-sugar epimerase
MFYHEEETIAPYRSFMIRLVSDLLLDRPVEVHAGTDRAWCHMEDGVEMMQRVLESGLYDISVDIGVSETISTEQLAAMVCRRLGKSLDLLRRVSLPERMHASKEADLNVIRRLGCAQQVALTAGLDRVIRRVKERLGIENHGA